MLEQTSAELGEQCCVVRRRTAKADRLTRCRPCEASSALEPDVTLGASTSKHDDSSAGDGDANSGMKVGDLAKRTGVSVRTLHYYDEIGLLRPKLVDGLEASRLRARGARATSANQVAATTRLQSRRSPRVSRRARVLPEPSASTFTSNGFAIRSRTSNDSSRCSRPSPPAIERRPMKTADDFINIIEEITMIERSFNAEELAEIKERGEKLGPGPHRAVEEEWPRLIAQVRREMLEGTDPASDRMRPLATRWRELVREFTGGNPNIERKVRATYIEEPKRAAASSASESEMFEYDRSAAIRALDWPKLPRVGLTPYPADRMPRAACASGPVVHIRWVLRGMARA